MSNRAEDRRKLPIHPDTRIGLVGLKVSHLERSLAFYQETLGLKLIQRDADTALMGVDQPLLMLTELREAKPRQMNATGLYHIAFLVPTRADLARFLRHLLDVAYPLDEASDHIVSEALYLADPDGNGIEVYRDRPRSAWPWQAGRLHATNSSDPLDTHGLLAELQGDDQTWHGLPPGTRVGHIHLQTADLDRSAVFYRDVLGFQETITGIAGGYFLAADGYHHHVALNTWFSLGGPQPPPDAVGLSFFTLCLPDEEEVKYVAMRLEAADIPFRRISAWDAFILHDLEGNSLLLLAGPLTDNKEVMSLANISVEP